MRRFEDNQAHRSLRTVSRNWSPGRGRQGKILVFMAILLPVLCGYIGFVLDGSLMMAEHRSAQHVCDAAATAAAMALYRGEGDTAARSQAEQWIKSHNNLADAVVETSIPPASGDYVGRSGYVEVVVRQPIRTRFIQVFGTSPDQTVRARSVAGPDSSTVNAAIVILDPQVPDIAVDTSSIAALAIPALSLPAAHVGGIECLGLGQCRVDGAVLVNSEWGGVDEDGQPAGVSNGPPWGINCTPILPLTKLVARDIRVVGGVDDPDNYGHFVSGEPSPLRANALAVPDPYRELPVPTTASDPNNVSATSRGGVLVTGLPLIGPPVHLQPGVYDWIQVTSGIAVFEPGIYIIRGKHPISQLSLAMIAGTVNAEGVMFYITNSTGYSSASGTPDSNDGETVAPGQSTPSLLPSVVITSLINSSISGLDDPDSPFDNVLIYQRRWDRRPIIFACQHLILGGTLQGSVYAKWAQVWFAGQGVYDLSFVAGSMRIANVLGITISPSHPLPPARDIFLVE
jgi:hypothetical protein